MLNHTTFALAALAGASIAGAGMVDGNQFVTLTFEGLPEGMLYGPGSTDGDVVGDFLFSEDGVDVFAEEFRNLAGEDTTSPTSFVEVTDTATGFDSQSLSWSGNLSLRFDFTGLGFNVERVEVDYIDAGGPKTVGVNGDLVGVSDFGDAGDDDFDDDVGVSVMDAGFGGSSTLVFEGADIDSITVGGDAMVLGEVTAFVPAPGAAALAIPAALLGLRRRR